MKKKFDKKIIILIFLALALFIYAGGLKNIKFFTTTITDSGISPSPYICPIGADGCDVRGVIKCNIPKKEGKVIFRTNAQSSDDYNEIGTWIAINAIPSGKELVETSDLKGYCRSSSTTSYAQPTNRITPHNNRIMVWNSRLYIETPSSIRLYTLCDNADLTPESKEPYSSNNQEIISGSTNLYSCSGEFRIIDNGNIINSEQIIYSDSVPGESKSSFYSLESGQKAEIIGGDENNIEYRVLEIKEECVKSICNPSRTGYFECINGKLSDKVTLCNQEAGEQCFDGSDGAECRIPFNKIDVTFLDSNKNQKSGFTSSEDIFLKIIISSEKISSGNLLIKVFEGENQIGSPIPVSNVQFDGKPLIIQLPNPSISGNYYVTLDISYLDNSITIGKDEKYNFRIAAPIILSMPLPYSPKTGTALYTTYPVYLDLKTTDANGNPVDVSSIDLKVKLNGVLIPNPDYVTPLPEPGLYRFIYEFKEPGLLEVRAKVNRFGVESNEVMFNQEIKRPFIITKFLNIGMLRSIPPSIQRVKFETRDSLGNLIDTNNIVKIIPPGASVGSGDIDVSNSVNRESIGTYYFDYNFDKVGGYSIRIISSAEGFEVGNIADSGAINVNPGNIPDECSTSEDCNLGEICIDGKCKTRDRPLLIYLIIGGMVVFIIVLTIIIFRLRKKQSVKLPGGL